MIESSIKYPDTPFSCELRVKQILDRLNGEETAVQFIFREVYHASALQEARLVDERKRSNQTLGPLDGAIVSVKDLFDVKGSLTVAGSRLLEAHAVPAKTDAPVVESLRRAGCVIIGRTNMSELAFSGVGNNFHYGTPVNPLDPECIPGGSSSGAAVSVSLGLADIGLGSDTGGSLRILAALCGVVGFKPSANMVSTAGTFPLSTTLDTIGPITASVQSCMQAFTVLSECNAPFVKPNLQSCSYRVGIVSDTRLTDNTEGAVTCAIQQATDVLRENGVLIESVDLSSLLDLLEKIDSIGTFPSIELAARLGPLSEVDKNLLDPEIWARLKAGYPVKAIDYLQMQRLRAQAIAHMQQLMQPIDAVLLPTVPIVAPKLKDMTNPAAFHEANRLLLRNTRVANLLNLPALSLPVPVQGRAVGMMLWGKTDQDWSLLNLAKDIEFWFDKN